jgi:hypothetical protein
MESKMLSMFALIAALLSQPQDDPGVWQDFGPSADGTRVLLNPDTVIGGEAGPEAMVRVRYARAGAGGAVLADYQTKFNCAARTATRELMGERDASGEIVSRHDEGESAPPITAAAGTPMGRVLDLVCEMTAEG